MQCVTAPEQNPWGDACSATLGSSLPEEKQKPYPCFAFSSLVPYQVHEWMSVPSSSKPLLSWCLCLRSSKIPPGDLSEDEWRKIEAPGRISSRINDFLSLQLMREMNGGVAAIAKKPLKDAEAGEGCSGGRTAGRASRCGDCPPEVHHEIVSSTLWLTRYAVCLIRGQGEEKAGEPIAHYLALLPCILLHPSPFR